MPRRLRPGDEDLVWVLTLDFAGTVYHWCSRAVAADVANLSGIYAGWFDPGTVEESLDLKGRNSPPTISAEVFFPADDPVAAAIAAGHRLDGATCEVALLPMSSGDWQADRYVVVTGVAADPQYGGPNEPVAFEIKRHEDADKALFPPSTWAVTEYTWPTTTGVVAPPGLPTPDTSTLWVPDDDSLGQAYPCPFGTPGAIGSTNVACVPVLVVNIDGGGNERLLVAGGHVTASTCQLFYEDGNGYTEVTATIKLERDAIGQPVTTIDLTGVAAAIRNAGSYFTAWPDGAIALPGIAGTAANVGGLAQFWLKRSSLPISDGGSSEASHALQAYQASGQVSEPTVPAEWLADRLVGDFPVGLGTDHEGGYHLVPIRWRAGAADAVASLTHGDSTVYRQQAVTMKGDGRSYRAAARWGRDDALNKYTRITYAASSSSGPASPTETIVEYPDVYDERTAALLARWLAWRDGDPHADVAIDVATSVWGWLSPGDVVLYTESEIGYAARPCIVMSVARTDTPWTRIRLTPTKQD